MYGSGYVIEDRPEGRTLVVTGPWTDETESAVHDPSVEGLWLNYARGFCEAGLSFIDEWPIRRLLVIDRSLTDLTPIGRLGGGLEDLSVQAAPSAEVDLAMLPRLRRLAATWESVKANFHAPDYLCELVVSDYTASSLAPLNVQASLQQVKLKGALVWRPLTGRRGYPRSACLVSQAHAA